MKISRKFLGFVAVAGLLGSFYVKADQDLVEIQNNMRTAISDINLAKKAQKNDAINLLKKAEAAVINAKKVSFKYGYGTSKMWISRKMKDFFHRMNYALKNLERLIEGKKVDIMFGNLENIVREVEDEFRKSTKESTSKLKSLLSVNFVKDIKKLFVSAYELYLKKSQN